MTSNTEFKTIFNGVNNHIKIIQHISTGYYNITKINNIIYDLKLKENEPTGIPVGFKKLNDWFRNKSNKEYMLFLKNQEQVNNLKLIINNSNDEFKGTYVHELLYDQILMWIDKTYAYKVSKILKEIHNGYNKKIKEENEELKEDVKEKSCKIDELKDLVNKQNEKIDKQSNDIQELLNHAKKTNEKLDDANDNINEINEKLDEAKDNIENLTDKVEEVRDEFREQTEHINPPPEDDDNIHMFVLLQYPNENNKFRIIRGQSKHLDKSITQDMNIVIDKRYHPNPIDAFTALKNKIKKLDKEEVKKIKDSYKNKTITREDKNDLLEDNRNSPAISIKYNTININYKKISLNEFIELVNKCADLGKETFIP